MTLNEGKLREYGWKGIEVEVPKALQFLIHDGDQQIVNPYGRADGYWTMYSFRPSDCEGPEGWPMIAITPASFQAISSMDDMLNSIPYVVVKEYFFKNTASMMSSLLKKIMGFVQETSEGLKEKDDGGDGSASTIEKIASTGGQLLDKIKDTFANIQIETSVIDIPYLLYCGLRLKLYGNTYVLPYIVSNSTVINQASNASEWGNGDEGGGLMESLKGALQGMANMVGGLAAAVTGSQARVANLFPAPTWGGPGKEKAQFSFDLILINDHIIKARNNYMCVNTIINNNRYMQKAILAFPGALYELWLPTGQRHLMCTGDFKLTPLGLNRATPKGFFTGGPSESGGNESIGTQVPGLTIRQPHQDEVEVIPDAYKLSMTFQSCLANNLNTSVFQYYVEMSGYKDYASKNMGGSENESDQTKGKQLKESLTGKGGILEKTPDIRPPEPADQPNANEQQGGGEKPKGQKQAETSSVPTRSLLAKGMRSAQARPEASPSSMTLEDMVEAIENFDESTYNKKLSKLKSQFGDIDIGTESAVATIKWVQKATRESERFLTKLYNAPSANLWYKDYEYEELDTEIEPDYRQILKKKYRQKIEELRKVQAEIDEAKAELKEVEEELSQKIVLADRNPVLDKRIAAIERLNDLATSREEVVGEVLQEDAKLLQEALDAHDEAMSVKRREISPHVFQQVWNEKIMNSYERDKLQYLTSTEKKRYFEEKVRELRKCDQYGILNHQDWFFRVVVLDYILNELRKLTTWFKNCTYGDFETVYKIVRKMNFLKLDIESIRNDEQFAVNKTNLFALTDENFKDYKKIDEMLSGNTLYELFKNQVSLDFIESTTQDEDDGSSEVEKKVDKELVVEQQQEIELERQISVRKDVVQRYWGSEGVLSKVAYDIAVSEQDRELDEDERRELPDGVTTVRKLKDEIVTLKLEHNPSKNELL